MVYALGSAVAVKRLKTSRFQKSDKLMTVAALIYSGSCVISQLGWLCSGFSLLRLKMVVIQIGEFAFSVLIQRQPMGLVAACAAHVASLLCFCCSIVLLHSTVLIDCHGAKMELDLSLIHI